MGRHLVNTIAMAAVVVAQLGFSAPAFAQSGEAIEAARRVNISGRQRMLSQRITKAACFLNIGAKTAGVPDELGDSVALFESSLQALQQGNVALGLGPERNPLIRNALGVVADDWATFSTTLQPALASMTIDSPTLAVLDAAGLQLLADMNSAVNKTASAYGEALPDMPLILSLTIDLAGRQRMFTQKAAKEFCLIMAGVEVEANRTRLAKTAELFSLTLNALQSGMPGMVMAAPNDEIRTQLTRVSEAWAGPKAVLESVAQGTAVTAVQQEALVNGIEQVLVLMNEAVGMYEKAIPAA
jgi:hypothetical protein